MTEQSKASLDSAKLQQSLAKARARGRQRAKPNPKNNYKAVRLRVVELLSQTPLLSKPKLVELVGTREVLNAFNPKTEDPANYEPAIVVVEYFHRNAILALRDYKDRFSRDAINKAKGAIVEQVNAVRVQAGLKGVESKKKKLTYQYRRPDAPLSRTKPPTLLTLLEEYRDARAVS